ncbi:MAG: hypothetical protein WDA27_01135 [Actinomycetota bacterium]
MFKLRLLTMLVMVPAVLAGSPAEAAAVVTINTVASQVGQYSSLAFGADGMPVIAYYSNEGLKLLRCGTAYCDSGNVASVLDNQVFRRDVFVALTVDRGLPPIWLTRSL